jgi:hypothetical protein
VRYDLEIGTPEAPTWEQLAAWAAGVELRLEPREGGLGVWPLPVELTYRRRAPIVHAAGVRSNPPEPGDRAAVIPPLA